jgi:hypothetical protein
MAKNIKIGELDIVNFVLEIVTMNDQLKLLEKARVELGEDELKKRQGIEHLRAWIKSQPNIRNCRQGDDDNEYCYILDSKSFNYINLKFWHFTEDFPGEKKN